jgi:hypothetical protein
MAMDMLPPKITLIHPSDPRCWHRLNDVHLDTAPAPLVVVSSSYDLEKFYTPPDHVLRYNESHTNSLHWQGDRMAYSSSDLQANTDDFPYILDPHNQLC